MNFNQVLEEEKDSKNIIIWYPFTTNSNILEIGANNFEITKTLLDKKNFVTSVVFSEEIQKQYLSNIKNDGLDVIFKDLSELKLEKKYDYILLIEIVKYLKLILPNSINPLVDILSFCKDNLSENGKIILATDNRLGIRNFCGNLNEGEEKIFESLQNQNKNYNLYSKQEIVNILKKMNLGCKFYYPFPNLKNANVIFSEKCLPNGNLSKINYNVLYGANSKVILDEINLIKQFSEINILDIFANSFFIEILNNNEQSNNNIEYIGFNNLRKEEYKTILTIEKNFATKSSYSNNSLEHIQNLLRNSIILKKCGLDVLEEKNNESSVKTRYISNDKLLDKVLCEALKVNEITEFFCIIDKFVEDCLSKLELDNKRNKIFNLEISEEIAEQLHFLKNGFIDLVFENVFYENDKFIIYDQEWNLENIPLEFIIYRAITNLYVHNKNLEKILKYDEVIKKYKLERFVDIFNRVENQIQDLVIEKSILLKYSNVEEVDINKLENQYIELVNKNKEKLEEIKKLQEENEKLGKFRLEIINSRSWKIIQKVKSIFYKRKKR